MNARFHANSDGEPHIHDHSVSEEEVFDVLERPLERVAGRDDSFVTIGRTRGGRILKVIGVPARDEDGILVITAFDLPARQVRALYRRMSRRRQS